jgi:adenylate kinase family enzyme
MADYDFSALNDKEFEILALDLLSGRDGLKYERFKPGKDAGVDGRFFQKSGTEIIVQCKHWPMSSLNSLSRRLQKEEVPKIQRLNPKSYIIALSHPLSRQNKSTIQDIFSPYIGDPANILGREDLNDLLSQQEDVERRHYKLWIASSSTLLYLMNRTVIDRSRFDLSTIQESACLYVATENHQKALDKLSQNGTVIITGPPGIGKTTLADQLVLHYVRNNFDFVSISDDIKDAESVYEPDKQQIYYFDDFLGRNYLEALSGRQDSNIKRFIDRVSRDKKKRFVLTSRTTIINQAKILSEVFQESSIKGSELEIKFDSLSDMDKAKILYNHMWHTSLDSSYIDQIYGDKRYLKIISHKNFNPRLVRYITDDVRSLDLPADQYWPFIVDMLDNPAKVWETPFEAQHDDFGRALILLVTLNSRQIEQSQLSEAYTRFIAHPDAVGLTGRRDYTQSLRILTGSMLKRTVSGQSEPWIDIFNPSIADFVLNRYKHDVPHLRAGFSSLRSISSLRALRDLVVNNLVPPDVERSILNAIIDKAYELRFNGYSPEYIALALINCHDEGSLLPPADRRIVAAAESISGLASYTYIADVAKIMQWRLVNNFASPQDIATFVTAYCATSEEGDLLELEAVLALVRELPDEDTVRVWPSVEEFALKYFVDHVWVEFSWDDVFRFLCPDDEKEAAAAILAPLICSRLQGLGLPSPASVVDEIIDAFDITESMREYFRTEPDEGIWGDIAFEVPPLEDIEDLFDRS